MGVRIDAARHDVAAGRIERLVAREVLADLGDPAAVEISSASLWLRPPTQGHMIMVEGATLLVQQASWPAPEMMFMWL
jgi:hypothetical protein